MRTLFVAALLPMSRIGYVGPASAILEARGAISYRPPWVLTRGEEKSPHSYVQNPIISGVELGYTELLYRVLLQEDPMDLPRYLAHDGALYALLKAQHHSAQHSYCSESLVVLCLKELCQHLLENGCWSAPIEDGKRLVPYGEVQL